jgi:hypothetical protein
VVAGSGGRGDGVIVDAKSPSSANKADVSVAVGTESDETDSVEPCPCCPMSPVVMRGKARRSTARHSRTYQQTAPLSVRVGGSKSQQQDNIQNRKSTASTAIECSCSCSAPTTGDNLQLICGWAVCMNACMSLYLLVYMYQEALLSPSLVLSCQSVLSGQTSLPASSSSWSNKAPVSPPSPLVVGTALAVSDETSSGSGSGSKFNSADCSSWLLSSSLLPCWCP